MEKAKSKMCAPLSTGWIVNTICPSFLQDFLSGRRSDLRAACPDPRVSALIGLGLPVIPIEGRAYDFRLLESCAKPKLFVSGSQDIFGPRAQLEQIVESAADPKKLVWIEGADHFFAGKLQELRETIEAWVRDMGPDRGIG